MSTITYEYKITVYLDGKAVGEIRSAGAGYKYFPTFSMHGGKTFPTIEACQAWLEEE